MKIRCERGLAHQFTVLLQSVSLLIRLSLMFPTSTKVLLNQKVSGPDERPQVLPTQLPEREETNSRLCFQLDPHGLCKDTVLPKICPGTTDLSWSMLNYRCHQGYISCRSNLHPDWWLQMFRKAIIIFWQKITNHSKLTLIVSALIHRSVQR